MLSNTKVVDIETEGNKLVETKKKVIRYILIIGNGFDIACGLKTKYIDFFNTRDEKRSLNYTKWDKVFDLAHDDLVNDETFQWVDVENIISNVVSIVLDFDTYQSNLQFKNDSSKYDFEQKIRELFITKSNETKYVIATKMLDELQKFERNFSCYIEKQIKSNPENYHENAIILIKRMLNIKNSVDKNVSIVADIINFNYSLDERFKKQLNTKLHTEGYDVRIGSWTNIHGIAVSDDKKAKAIFRKEKLLTNPDDDLPKIIFGIDEHDSVGKDNKYGTFKTNPKLMFTKSYRLLINNINSIRMQPLPNDPDNIVFLGHSLGHADYSYFESLFDNYNLFENNKLHLTFFYDGGSSQSEKMENSSQMIQHVMNLLNYYGQTLEGEHGENIVNRLVLDQRISLCPNQRLDR